MTKEEENSSNSGLQVKVSKYGSPRIASLLKKTVFGTEGKLRYTQNDIVDRIKSQANIQFIEILKGKRVLGTVGMANRPVVHGDEPMLSQYVRYLSIAQPFNSKKRTVNHKSAEKKQRSGTLRESIANEITIHFEQPYLDSDRQGMFYSYVESANLNSRNLCLSMGFEPARKVETLLFSRFSPNQQKTIHNIAEEEQDQVKEELQKFYNDYSFYFEDKIFHAGFYLVKKEKNKIIGGLRAVPVNWKLIDYPGFEGWLMRDILPYLPLTNRLFQPDKLTFLAFDYAWHEPNHEHVIPELMSHCCSLFGIHLGMIWGDMHSDLIKNLKSGNQLGFIHSVVGSVYADLMIRPINFYPKVEDEVEELIEEKGETESQEAEKSENQEKESTSEPPTSEDIVINEDVENSNDSNSNELDEESELEPDIDNSDSESDQNEKIDQLIKILQKPVFVSALDMT